MAAAIPMFLLATPHLGLGPGLRPSLDVSAAFKRASSSSKVAAAMPMSLLAPAALALVLVSVPVVMCLESIDMQALSQEQYMSQVLSLTWSARPCALAQHWVAGRHDANCGLFSIRSIRSAALLTAQAWKLKQVTFSNVCALSCLCGMHPFPPRV